MRKGSGLVMEGFGPYPSAPRTVVLASRMLPSFLHYVRLSYSEERSERLTERDEPSMLTTEGDE